MIIVPIFALICLSCRIVSVKGGWQDEVWRPCCQIGESWQEEKEGKCPRYLRPLAAVRVARRSQCSHVAQACCIRRVRSLQCLQGREMAQNLASCVDLYNSPLASVKKECCHCCLIGREVAGSNVSCRNVSASDNLSEVCRKTALSCCFKMAADEESVKVDGIASHKITVPQTSAPPTTADFHSGNSSAPVTPPKSTQATPTEGGLCEKFRGKLCEQICENSLQSYKCRCRQNYTLRADGRSCRTKRERDFCRQSECEHLCRSSANGATCICYTGYQLQPNGHTCQDVDDCSAPRESGGAACPAGRRCVNTIGSFRCENLHPVSGTCPDGFSYDASSRRCEDVDECAQGLDACLSSQQCENSIGSYACRRFLGCGTGYTLDRISQRCADVDECAIGTDDCRPGQTCRNTEGSFRCEESSCPFGYRLTRGKCQQVRCPPGFQPDSDGQCQDVNECEWQQSGRRPCLQQQECINNPGSYSCRNKVHCHLGFKITALGGTTCTDIDECAEGFHDCRGALTSCVNTAGSYRCACADGYELHDSHCVDVDECSRYSGSVCPHNSQCLNEAGSFRCVCNSGFESDTTAMAAIGGSRASGVCQDVDECTKSPGICQHNCRNSWGSYHCTCHGGYRLDHNKRSCIDVDECAVEAIRYGRTTRSLSPCAGVCRNTPGSFTCSCPAGFRMLPDARACQDVDECALGSTGCDGYDKLCINIRGGYKCESKICPAGFIRINSPTSKNADVRCQRQSFVCNRGDLQCLKRPLTYSINFMTFPVNVNVPADLFTMRSGRSRFRKYQFSLSLIRATPTARNVTAVTEQHFRLEQRQTNKAVIKLQERITGPQDIELKMSMKIYSREFSTGNSQLGDYMGTTVAIIKMFVTDELNK